MAKVEEGTLRTGAVSERGVRTIAGLSLLILLGCRPELEFHNAQAMSRHELLKRAGVVFIGVIEKQELASWPILRLTIPLVERSEHWKVCAGWCGLSMCCGEP